MQLKYVAMPMALILYMIPVKLDMEVEAILMHVASV